MIKWLETKVATVIIEIAKHVLTREEVLAMFRELIELGTSKVKAMTAVLRTASSVQAKVVPPVLAAYGEYVNRYNHMSISPAVMLRATEIAKILVGQQARYKAIEAATGVPWWFIGLLHYREGNLKLNTYLGNGQSLYHKTTETPKGRGPFVTFEDGAIDALEYGGFDKVKYWDLGRALYLAEKFNGRGYHDFHDMQSPYVWAGSNWYVKGKYDSDGHFNPNLVDMQLGAAVLLKAVSQLTPLDLK